MRSKFIRSITLHIPNVILGTAVMAAAISAVGGIIYSVWNLSTAAMMITLLLVASGIIFYFLKIKSHHDQNNEPAGGLHWLILLPIYSLLGVCFILLVRSISSGIITSPWNVITKLFWPAVISTAVLAVTALRRIKDRGLIFFIIFPLLSLGVSVAAIICRLGYGFDPFIHQAAERYILEHGLITPKTIYYAGQYALVTIISRVSSLPVHYVDVWLVPALAALSLPAAFLRSLKHCSSPAGLHLICAMIFLPLGVFILTTPFNLAALYLTLSAIMAMSARQEPLSRISMWVFAVGALMTHPIAGVPALCLAALSEIHGRKIGHQILRCAVVVAGAAVLPLLFTVVSGSHQGELWSSRVSQLLAVDWPWQMPITRYHSLRDLVYFSGILSGMVVVVCATLRIKNNFNHLLSAFTSIVSGLLIAVFVSFSYLPDYERSGYAARLMVVALLLLIPAALPKITQVLERSFTKPAFAIFGITAVVFLIASNVYLSYPRDDAYVLGHGYNTTAADIETVNKIAADAGNEPYIVLGSQPVSAAALSEFGFFRYLQTSQGQIFAYPVPTGGALYSYYLRMIGDELNAQTMNEAMDFAGVRRAYLVINRYWLDADTIIAHAKKTTDQQFSIGDDNFVFGYTR